MLRLRYICHALAAISLVPALSACIGESPFGESGLGILLNSEPDPATLRCLTPPDADELAGQLLQLINLERSAVELDPVVPDGDGILSEVAADYACQMITGGFFAHEHPATKTTPSKRISVAGYRATAVGENLAAGQRNPAEVIAQWMESESHRANILSPEWREAGLAVRTGGVYDIYWVLELAEPRRDLSDESDLVDDDLSLATAG